MVTKIAKVVFLVFGAFAIMFGLVTLVSPSALHSEAARSLPFMHNLREQGAAISFVGLMMLWCSFNYEQSRMVHYLLTFFTLLVSAVHWYDYSIGYLPLISPIYNTVPFLVFASLALARMQTGVRGDEVRNTTP